MQMKMYIEVSLRLWRSEATLFNLPGSRIFCSGVMKGTVIALLVASVIISTVPDVHATVVGFWERGPESSLNMPPLSFWGAEVVCSEGRRAISCACSSSFVAAAEYLPIRANNAKTHNGCACRFYNPRSFSVYTIYHAWAYCIE